MDKRQNKKLTIIFVVLGAIISGYLGYLVGGIWYEGIGIQGILDGMNKAFSHPFGHYWNQYSVRAIVIALSSYSLVMLLYLTSRRNLMPGKEYGTAKFADVHRLTQRFSDKNPDCDRLLSRNFRMSINTRKTKLNNNVLVVGGSGAGKTFYMVKPNLLQMNTSFVITDPKAELWRTMAPVLRNNGYKVRVINLIDPKQSDGYNPFAYLREQTDVVKLITNLISNTTPKGSNPPDPFWVKAEEMFLQSLFYYVWYEYDEKDRNFGSVMKLIKDAEVTDQKKQSHLDELMTALGKDKPNHPAYVQYCKCMRGAADTVRSIIISANSRLAMLENPDILRILDKDEMNLSELGVGVNGDKKTKTATFCVIPDNDKSYNFIIGMLYTQMFQELYYQADFVCGGKLPIHVTFMLDEFVNVALPDDFCSLLSTMRSREISSVIIIQNLAQIKALFKETWETIPGNCDTLVYLGGNEQSTHKYISELLGKGTIDKRSNGETRGRQGSASRNFDVIGRDLLTADEVRMLDNRKCLVFVRGVNPILDDKFVPMEHPRFAETPDAGVEYPNLDQERKSEKSVADKTILLSKQSLDYYKKLEKLGYKVKIDTLTVGEIYAMTEQEFSKRMEDLERGHEEEAVRERNATEIAYRMEPMKYPEDEKPLSEEEIFYDRFLDKRFSDEQRDEAAFAVTCGLSYAEVLQYFTLDKSAEEMRSIREQIIKSKEMKGETNNEKETE